MFFSKKYCIRDENMVCFYRKRDFRLSKKGTAMKFSIRTIAKNLYEAIRSASLYTVIISVFLLVFIAETGFDSAAIVFRDYVTIFLVSLLIAFASFLFKIKRLPKFISYILHYSALLISLTAVFIFSDKLLLRQNTSQAFSLLFVFTVLYVVLAVLFYVIKRIAKQASSAFPEKAREQEAKKQEQNEEDYHSIL